MNFPFCSDDIIPDRPSKEEAGREKRNSAESARSVATTTTTTPMRALREGFRKQILSEVSGSDSSRSNCCIMHIRNSCLSSRSIHLIWNHSSEKPHQCSQCDSAFKTKPSLKNHVASIHSNERYETEAYQARELDFY